MDHIRPLLRRRISLLVVTLAVLASILPMTRQTAYAEYCGTGFAQVFYSDASETTIVGRCNRDCTGATRCTGTKTEYSTVVFFNCCS